MVPLLLLFAVAFVPAFDPSAVAQAPRPADLAVESVVVLPPGPRWVFDEPRNATVQATVRNVGESAAAYQLVFQWRNAAFTGFLNEDDVHSTDVSDQGPLLRGERRTHNITWRPQPGQVGIGEIVVTVVAPGGGNADANRDNDKAFTDGTVPKLAARLDVAGRPPPLHRGETGFMDIFVANIGTSPIGASLLLMDAAQGNRSRLVTSIEPATLSIAAGATGRSTLYVTFPADARDDTPFVANFSLRAVTSFSKNLTVPTPNATTARGLAPTNQSLSVEGPAPGTLFVPRGRSVTVPVALTNTGEEDDTYVVDLRPDGGWMATASASRLGVHAGETRTISVTIDSGFLDPGATGIVHILIRSEHGRVSWERELAVRASGAAIMWAAVRPIPGEWYAGEPGAIEVDVRNNGDETPSADGFVKVEVRSPGAGTTHTSTLKVRPPAFSTTTVKTVVPAMAAGGTADVSISWTGPSDAAAPPAHVGTLLVHSPALMVDPPSTSGAGIAGEGVAYRQAPGAFRVTNLGDTSESITIEATAEIGGVTLEGGLSTFALPPGATRVLPLVHELPLSTGNSTADNVTLRAFVTGHPSFVADARILTKIEDHTAPVIGWMPEPPQLWTKGRPLPLSIRPLDSADIRNGTLRALREEGGHESVALTRASDGSWTGVLTTERIGNYTVRAWAADVFQNVGASLPIKVEIRAIPQPTVAFVRPLQGATVSTGDVVELNMEQSTGVMTVLLTGTPVDGVGLFQTKMETSNSSVNFTLPKMKSGDWQLYVQVLNAFGGSGEAVVNIRVPEPPAAITSDALGTGLGEPVDTSSVSTFLAIVASALGVLCSRAHRQRKR